MVFDEDEEQDRLGLILSQLRLCAVVVVVAVIASRLAQLPVAVRHDAAMGIGLVIVAGGPVAILSSLALVVADSFAVNFVAGQHRLRSVLCWIDFGSGVVAVLETSRFVPLGRSQVVLNLHTGPAGYQVQVVLVVVAETGSGLQEPALQEASEPAAKVIDCHSLVEVLMPSTQALATVRQVQEVVLLDSQSSRPRSWGSEDSPVGSSSQAHIHQARARPVTSPPAA